MPRYKYEWKDEYGNWSSNEIYATDLENATEYAKRFLKLRGSFRYEFKIWQVTG